MTRLPPAPFERYMAASARCIRSSTSSPGCTSATPTLAVTPDAWPMPATASRSRSASISPEKAAGDVGQDGELVAAQPGHRVGLPDGAAERGAHRAEHRVAGGVTAGVVDGLEAVEVDEADHGLVAPGGGVDGIGHPLEVGPPVGDAGERVGGGQRLLGADQQHLAVVGGPRVGRRHRADHREGQP